MRDRAGISTQEKIIEWKKKIKKKEHSRNHESKGSFTSSKNWRERKYNPSLKKIIL